VLPALTAQQATWYLTRSTGAVCLLLLTAAVVLGIVEVLRVSSPAWPRFAIDLLHRDVSLLAFAFLVVHVLTTLLNTFTSIGPLEAIVPFVSGYRSLWLGLGAIAFDLLIAVMLTSLLRKRISYPTFKVVHWLVYASWPVAVLHGMGTGSDTNGAWMLIVDAICVLAVFAACAWRVHGSLRADPATNRLAIVAGVVLLGALGLWLARGPLASEWARRSGTPRVLLGKAEREVTDR
jgi:sulfoxide reductase heme-binding subunit YedZ